MALTPGTRLGPYEVVGVAGSGGMGEVWRARDTRLDRSVAIKTLPAEFATNAQLRLRFEREAKVISQLTHPHICTLYDVGHDRGLDYLVMEYLEGETLAERIQKGPLPVEQVVRYGIEIAGALENAHKAGVTHRDLKPANVMLTKSGVKLLDFGLAKPAAAPVVADLMSQQTEAKQALTEEGTIVGTFQYMAPEQIEAGEIDRRTDIFALGAVLYEMATGRRAFHGKSKASLIASILASEPQPISAVQPTSPAMLDRIIRTCLAKEPDARFQSAHDVAEALRWVLDVRETTAPRTRRGSAIAWSLAALFALAALAAGAILWRDVRARRTALPIRTALLPPAGARFAFVGGGSPPAISADGRKIVFGVAKTGTRPTLWVRSLDALAAQELPGTLGASYPFWSPDGRTVAFFADGALKKMDVSGGAAVTICDGIDGRGGSWSSDGGTIIFADRYSAIKRVPAAGGTPIDVTKTDENTTSHRWPEFLPDSPYFLYLASPIGSQDPRNTIRVGSIDGNVEKTLITAANDPHYVKGHILFVRDRILTVQRFDPKKLELVGDAVPLKEQPIEDTPQLSKTIVSVSRAGTLLYQTGLPARESQPVWRDRSGKELGAVAEPGLFNYMSLSPDAKMVVVSRTSAPQTNLWMYDLARGVKSRLTFGDSLDVAPVWSPDSRKIIYGSIRPGGSFDLMLRDLATGSEQRLLHKKVVGTPSATSWSNDGQRILFNEAGKRTRGDIWWMAIADGVLRPYLSTTFPENSGRFSPDGKWVAYQSSESGAAEVYIAPFPPTGAKWQVSVNRGGQARWRGDGKELYFAVSTGSEFELMAVPVELGVTPQIGAPVALFSFRSPPVTSSVYDVTSDGQRFLVNARVGEDLPPEPVMIVQNFDRELRDAFARE